ncbi:ABC transporter permease [Pseudosulfitobacter pseudonitzschiae]|uniref:ABC transporter permease n=1 Tax=Pseudosulfitobacter pseudonitzschiae TaxID=1402135 RepID=UPI001CD485E0|nr:ABC transporter permease subunit [Pseudosulfitobacter pseudonitzschiae]
MADRPFKLMYNDFGVVMGLVHVLLPFMIIAILSVLMQISRNLEEASMSLGGRPFYSFRTVLLPLSLPGILTGVTLVYLMSTGAIVTPLLLGGLGDTMIGTEIFQEVMHFFDYPRPPPWRPSCWSPPWPSCCRCKCWNAGCPTPDRWSALMIPRYIGIAVLLFLPMPILIVVLSSFTSAGYLSFPDQGSVAALVCGIPRLGRLAGGLGHRALALIGRRGQHRCLLCRRLGRGPPQDPLWRHL